MGGEAVGNLSLFRQSQGEVETAVMEPLREGRLDAWQDAGDVVEEQGVLHDAFRMGEGGDFQVDVHHAAGEGGEVAVLHHAVAHVQPFTAQVVVAEGAALLRGFAHGSGGCRRGGGILAEHVAEGAAEP